MTKTLLGSVLLMGAGVAYADPFVFTDKDVYLTELAALGLSVVHESFEDDIVWADSRNSIVSPGSTSSVTSQGIEWTSNYSQNNLATGTVGGSAPDGAFAIYSLPHGMATDSGLYCDSAEDPEIPVECYQNDGLQIRMQTGDMLYAFGGRIDTANLGKITFLLDGVDINGNQTDNVDNWQREGDLADDWTFVGVIDTDGFYSAELRELRGKDYQQVLLFSDDFTIGMTAVAEPAAGDFDEDGDLDVTDIDLLLTQITAETPDLRFDVTADDSVNHDDLSFWVHDLKRTWFGDANLDLQFDSHDMVQVFAGGKYETGNEAGWAEGEWNADGLFSSDDMIAAFVDGGYEQGRQPQTIAVPEPGGWWLLLMSLPLLAIRRSETLFLPLRR